jgi:hypothetical protein
MRARMACVIRVQVSSLAAAVVILKQPCTIYYLLFLLVFTGQSTCLACSFGSFAASPVDAACTPCAPSSWCFFGGAAPISRAILDSAAASGSFNPFKHALEVNSAGLSRLLIALGCVGAVLVVLILAAATAAHVHPRARQLVLGDTPDRAQMWAALDIMFSFVHFTPKGSVMRRRGTSFGGMVSLACSVAIVVLSAMLATKNLLNPNYIQSVSADALAANPTGTFRLRARVFGGGTAFASACDGMSIASRAGDAAGWIHFGVSNSAANATRPAVASFDANGHACLLEWKCEQCQISGSVSSTVLSLRSKLPSWATYVNFSFEAPSFVIADATPTAAPVAAASSGIGGAGEAFSTHGSISPQPVALRGVDAAATQVAISLIGVDAQTPSGERAAAFSALVGSIVIPTAVAATTDAASFDFGSGAGFQIDFVVQRSQTVIVWFVGGRTHMHVCILYAFGLCVHFLIWFALLALLVGAHAVTRTIDDGAVFNVIVLIGSLISTVVVAFTIIMRTLEEYCRISTSEPNKHVIGDQVLTTASAESARAAVDKATGGVGNESVGSSFNGASSGYADFDSGGGRDIDDTDDGRVQGSLPFHGNVIFQASGGGECAIEMQNVQKLPPSIPPSLAPAGSPPHASASERQHHAHGSEVGVNLNAQIMAILSSMQMEMRGLAERSESQHAAVAALTAQVARSESQHAAQVARSESQMAALVGELATLKDDVARQFDSQDQKISSAVMTCSPASVNA